MGTLLCPIYNYVNYTGLIIMITEFILAASCLIRSNKFCFLFHSQWEIGSISQIFFLQFSLYIYIYIDHFHCYTVKIYWWPGQSCFSLAGSILFVPWLLTPITSKIRSQNLKKKIYSTFFFNLNFSLKKSVGQETNKKCFWPKHKIMSGIIMSQL